MRKPGKPPKDGADKGPKDGTTAWHRLTQQTRPLSPAQRNRHIDKAAGDSKKAKNTEKAAASLPPSEPPPPGSPPSGPLEALHGAAPQAQRAPAESGKPPPRSGIEQRARRRLGRGRLAIDGTLDMHGMTLAEAQAALNGFITYHRAQGHQWVLVITGKGMRGEGRLRRALPDWLAMPPLAQQVVEYDAAAVPHGGSGAFYLRLRRAAKPKP